METDEFKALVEAMSKFDEKIKRQITSIQRQKLDWTVMEDDAVNVDEDLDEEELKARFTSKRGSRGSERPDRGERG